MRERFPVIDAARREAARGANGSPGAAVDGDDGLDEHWRKERDQDAEDRYFDED